MIQLITQCGICLVVGCVLTLIVSALIRAGAPRPAKRQFTEATPLTASDMQADKDQMRAEFVMSVRRLEIGMEKMREKAMARLGPATEKRAAEMNRLQAELDKKAALIVALRARAEVRRAVAGKIVKVLLYLFARMRRRQRTAVVAPPLFKFEQGPPWELKKQPAQNDDGPVATTIAAKTQPVQAALAVAATVAAKARAVQKNPAAAPPRPAEARPAQNGRSTNAAPRTPKVQPAPSDLAATAAAIAAVNLKRRRAISNKV